MLSTCPSCLSQVNHADHLFDVTCECGAHFSPYLNVDDPKSSPFSESQTAFKDIVQFGENIGSELETPIAPPVLNTTKIFEPEVAPPHTLGEMPMTGMPSKEILITTGSEISGYGIQTHYAPISFVTPFQSSSPNPIQNGIQMLWKNAEAQGANGIVGLQTSFTPDGQNLLLIGIPVRCTKVV